MTGVVGAVQVFRRRRTKRPCWAIRSHTVIRDFKAALPALSVLYEGKEVENLTVSRVLFWNKGAETMRDADVASTDQVRIVCQAGSLLSARVLQTNNHANQVVVHGPFDGTTASIHFEFLDEGHGAVIQLIHTGSHGDVTISGTIMGAGTPVRVRIGAGKVFELGHFFFFALVAVAIGVLGGGPPSSRLLYAGIAAVAGLVILLCVSVESRRSPYPKGLEEFGS